MEKEEYIGIRCRQMMPKDDKSIHLSPTILHSTWSPAMIR